MLTLSVRHEITVGTAGRACNLCSGSPTPSSARGEAATSPDKRSAMLTHPAHIIHRLLLTGHPASPCSTPRPLHLIRALPSLRFVPFVPTRFRGSNRRPALPAEPRNAQSAIRNPQSAPSRVTTRY